MTTDHPGILNGLRRQLHLAQLQVAEYESGRPERRIENGIYAAHKCAEMAAKYRQRVNNLGELIAAYEYTENDFISGPAVIAGEPKDSDPRSSSRERASEEPRGQIAATHA